jgi:preprotein translocase subunit SecF
MDSATEFVDDFLTHFGVKGMKWGVRKSRTVTVSQKGKKLKTSGGAGRPAHEDAIRARTIGQIGKASGLQALSNKELNDYANRLNLEQRVKDAQVSTSPNVVKKWIHRTVQSTQNESAKAVGKSVGGQLGREAVRLATPHVTKQIKKQMKK